MRLLCASHCSSFHSRFFTKVGDVDPPYRGRRGFIETSIRSPLCSSSTFQTFRSLLRTFCFHTFHFHCRKGPPDRGYGTFRCFHGGLPYMCVSPHEPRARFIKPIHYFAWCSLCGISWHLVVQVSKRKDKRPGGFGGIPTRKLSPHKMPKMYVKEQQATRSAQRG